jgi:DNA-damage-inducible protein D
VSQDLVDLPAYRSTMERLEGVKRATAEGEDYWLAREINELLGYPGWREFEAVVERARSAFAKNGIDPSHQIVLTHKMMEVGKGAQRQGDDYFLSRPACYLIAMNGDPSKPEIAAAQAYFAIKTRQMEILEQEHPDVRRVAARERVTHSFRRVSGAAKDAGVQRQVFSMMRAIKGYTADAARARLGDLRALAKRITYSTLLGRWNFQHTNSK